VIFNNMEVADGDFFSQLSLFCHSVSAHARIRFDFSLQSNFINMYLIMPEMNCENCFSI